MGTRGWTLSTFVGCCVWILHGMSYIFLLAHLLPEPLQGKAGTVVRCFSLLAALETPLMTSPCNTLQPKSWKSVLPGRHHPEGLVAGVDPWERREPSPGACMQPHTPPAREAKEASQQSGAPGMLPFLPHPGEEQMPVLHAGAPLAQASHEWAAWGRWRFLLRMEELR